MAELVIPDENIQFDLVPNDFDTYIDNDQTSVKSVYADLSNPVLGTGDNSDRAKADDENDQTFHSSPALDPDGNIESGQRQTDQYRAFKLEAVIQDRLDSELQNLTKDLYISTILDITNACEDTLSFYRNELALRVSQSDNPPPNFGILKDRRNSSKGSIAEKYANDCFQLNQYLLGNTSDIDDLFKKPQTPFRQSLSQTPKQVPDLQHDTFVEEQHFLSTIRSAPV